MMSKPHETINDVRHLTAEQLFHLGAQDLAYVKTVRGEGAPRYVVYSAEGAEMAVFADREVAFAAVRQNELEPLSLH